MGTRFGLAKKPIVRKAFFTLGGMAALAGLPGCNSKGTKPSTTVTSTTKPVEASPVMASAAPKVSLPELPLPKAQIEQIIVDSWASYKKTRIVRLMEDHWPTQISTM